MNNRMLIATLFFDVCLQTALTFQQESHYLSEQEREDMRTAFSQDRPTTPDPPAPAPAKDPMDEPSWLVAETQAVEDWLKEEARAKRAKAQSIKPLMPSEWINMIDKTMEQAVNDQKPFEDK